MKRFKTLLIALALILAIILLLLPFAVYFYHFYQASPSDDTSSWGDFGNYINGTLAPMIGIIGIVITFAIFYTSRKSQEESNKRQEKAQRPFLYISHSDFINNLSINISNKGLGPLEITEYYIKDQRTGENYKSFFEVLLFLDRDMEVDNYSSDQTSLVLSPNESRNLLRYKYDLDDGSEPPEYFSETRDLIRNAIKDLKICAKYKDVYGNDMEPYEKSLDWFGREVQY